MIRRWNDGLLGAAGIYLALLPTNALTFWRSLFFGLAVLLMLVVARIDRTAIPAVHARRHRVPVFLFWAWGLWATASLAWSAHFDYSVGQWPREIGWTVVAIAFFALATRDARAWRRLVATLLAAIAALAALSLAMAGGSPPAWDASAFHGGIGQWSTVIVIVAPLVLMFLAPRPWGFVGARRRWWALLAMLVTGLLLASARISDNRMVWVALATVFATASALAALRWRHTLSREPLRWLLPLACLLAVLSMLFATTAREKAQQHFPPETTLAQSFAGDPRIALWNHTLERVRERPWLGFGLGRSIIGDELRQALGDPLLSHPHNLFVSQWVQLGGIGLAAFVGLLAALLWRYVAMLRDDDDGIALLGVVGIALVLGFVVKNLTDDFLYGASARLFWALNTMLVVSGGRSRRPAAGHVG